MRVPARFCSYADKFTMLLLMPGRTLVAQAVEPIDENQSVLESSRFYKDSRGLEAGCLSKRGLIIALSLASNRTLTSKNPHQAETPS